LNHLPVTLPRLTALAIQAVPRLLECVVAPLAVFYAALSLLGETGAMIATAGWVYAGMVWRLIRRRPVPRTMVLAAFAITFRMLIGLWTGTAVFFLLPELSTICISMIFLASVRLRRPLVEKLTLDYIHLPSAVLRHERVRRFFARITLLWAFVLLTNSAVSIWLLLHNSIAQYVLIRPVTVALISGAAIGVSIYAFRRVLHRLHHDAPVKAITPA
jgi:hypothetical protein